MIELIIGFAIFGIFIVYTFIKGVQIGQKINSNEKIEIKNPIAIVKEHHKNSIFNKEALQEAKEIEDMLYNIDTYDGTGIGQRDI